MMKKNIIISAALVLICLAGIYILNARGNIKDLNNKLILMEKEIDALTLRLGYSKNEIEILTSDLSRLEQVDEERKARIDQLIRGYPPGIWGCDSDADWVVFKQELENATLDKMISELNEPDGSSFEPIIIFIKQDGSNVLLTVSDSEQLTERMGSAGANCYLARVVYSVTSIEGIDSVTFEFEEGSHAVPGNYVRAYFEP